MSQVDRARIRDVIQPDANAPAAPEQRALDLPAERVALITGATGVLGREIARKFAAGGARLALGGTDAARLAAMATELGLAEGAWTAAAGDLRDGAGARSAVQAALDRFGRVDALIHAVGGWAAGGEVANLDHEVVRELLDQHLWTTIHAVQAVLPGMRARGSGRVVAVTTPYAERPGKGMAAYAVAKASQETLLRTLAREVAGSGVTVNVVAVRTIDAKLERERAPASANVAWTTPAEIADAIAFLCSPEADAINGARIALDGRA